MLFCATLGKNYFRVFILEISSVSYTPHFSVSLLSLLFGEKVWALDELLSSIL